MKDFDSLYTKNTHKLNRKKTQINGLLLIQFSDTINLNTSTYVSVTNAFYMCLNKS